jgi:hypothetical protein
MPGRPNFVFFYHFYPVPVVAGLEPSNFVSVVSCSANCAAADGQSLNILQNFIICHLTNKTFRPSKGLSGSAYLTLVLSSFSLSNNLTICLSDWLYVYFAVPVFLHASLLLCLPAFEAVTLSMSAYLNDWLIVYILLAC